MHVESGWNGNLKWSLSNAHIVIMYAKRSLSIARSSESWVRCSHLWTYLTLSWYLCLMYCKHARRPSNVESVYTVFVSCNDVFKAFKTGSDTVTPSFQQLSLFWFGMSSQHSSIEVLDWQCLTLWMCMFWIQWHNLIYFGIYE